MTQTEDLEPTRVNYKLATGKNVSFRYKNDKAFMLKKIEEATPQIVKQVLPEKASSVKKGDTVEVYGKDENLVRVYSKEAHGSKYEELAKQFTEKLNK